MNYLFGLMRFLCTVAMLISTFYTVSSLAIVLFIANGTLKEGSPMWIDTDTPSLAQAISVAGICALVTGLLAYARHKLRPSPSP